MDQAHEMNARELKVSGKSPENLLDLYKSLEKKCQRDYRTSILRMASRKSVLFMVWP